MSRKVVKRRVWYEFGRHWISAIINPRPQTSFRSGTRAKKIYLAKCKRWGKEDMIAQGQW